MTRTYVATDACGNVSAPDTQVITVVDTTAPTIECPADITHECDETPDYGVAVGTDTCGDVTISLSETTEGDGCETVITRTYVATDACGNEATCTQTITIEDTTAPVITGAPTLDAPCDFTSIDLDVTVTDNCNEWTLTHEDEVVSGGCAGQVIRTCLATDACGNQSEPFIQIIDLFDDVAPEIECPQDVILECGSAIPAPVAPEFSDNCTEVTLSMEETTTGESCETVITRTWTATDNCNNSSSCSYTITFEDTQAPTMICPADVSHECDETVAYGIATASDSCSDVTVTSLDVTSGGTCETIITRTWTATDACGNSTTCDQTITIIDTEAPTFVNFPSNTSYQCEGDVPAQVNPNGTDNCQVADVTCTSVEDLDECGNGTITWTCTVSDGCGNANTDSYTITIEDTTAPELTSVPADIVLDCDDEIPAVSTVGATDNCDDSVEVMFEEVLTGDLPEEGSIADCVLSTPAAPVCHPYEDWALRLFDFPGYEFYSTVSASFVEYEDGTAHLTGSVEDNSNPGSGFTIDVRFMDGMNWDDWSSQTFPTSFKDDCETAAVTGEFENWTYYIMTPGQATLTGYGALAGSFFDLQHAPINNFYAYQVGNGANNVNDNYGNGGWFTATGQFVLNGATPISVENFQGDFAFDADCCPQYEITRTWYAVDCSGNMSDIQTQTISFEDQGEDEEPAYNMENEISSVEGGLYIGNIFPNPVRGEAQITYKVSETSIITLDVLDMNGNLVETIFTGNAEAGVTYNEILKTAGIESGVYMVRLASNSSSTNQRVVVAK